MPCTAMKSSSLTSAGCDGAEQLYEIYLKERAEEEAGR